jgi:Protein of unknown function (DUF1549)
MIRTILFALLLVTIRAFAGLTPQQTQQAAAQIDSLLAAHWKTADVAAGEPISDETFLRRIYLDLAGRIPTAAEAVAFLGSKAADKRSALIQELLSRARYVSHFYNFWADILRFKSTYVNRAGVVEAGYEKFIKESLRANRPYDQFVREMLSAKGYVWDTGAVGYYLRDRRCRSITWRSLRASSSAPTSSACSATITPSINGSRWSSTTSPPTLLATSR